MFFAADDFHAQHTNGPEMGLDEGEQGAEIREWDFVQVKGINYV